MATCQALDSEIERCVKDWLRIALDRDGLRRKQVPRGSNRMRQISDMPLLPPATVRVQVCRQQHCLHSHRVEYSHASQIQFWRPVNAPQDDFSSAHT